MPDALWDASARENITSAPLTMPRSKGDNDINDNTKSHHCCTHQFLDLRMLYLQIFEDTNKIIMSLLLIYKWKIQSYEQIPLFWVGGLSKDLIELVPHSNCYMILIF